MSITILARRVTAILGLVAALVFSGVSVSEAQQINPTTESVTEGALMEQLRGDDYVAGRVSIPDANSARLIKPGNKGWADTHTGTVRFLSIAAVVGAVVVLTLFYLIRGKIRIDAGMSGIRILRFNGVERFAHWLMAGSFIVLALTGLNLVLGRTMVLPWLGESAFSTVTTWGKVSHNFVGWAFMLGLILTFLIWVADNLPSKVDGEWIAQGGGLLKKGVHPPARKFNAGQKLIFWSVTLGGAALSFTGFMLLFPALAGNQADWQLYQLIHGLVAAALSFVIIAHIYIGSVGMEGAFDAMGSGEVDLNWAKEHHSIWVEEVSKDPAYTPHPKGTQPAE